MFLFALLAAAVFVSGPMPESGSLRGEAAIEAFGVRGVAVYIDTDRNDSFDHVFLLQVAQRGTIDAAKKFDHETGSVAEESIASQTMPERSHLGDVNVEFTPGYVRVTSGNDAIELFVEGTQSAAWNPAGARVWRRAGYGLVHQIYDSGIAIRREGRERSITAEYCDASSSCDPGDVDDGSGGGGGGGAGTTLCDAGGPGSTSCSVTSNGQSCTSTCGTGYYACCMYGNPPKCRCISG